MREKTSDVKPGPPFAVGDRVAFFPAVISPISTWLVWDYAVIDDVDEDAQTFGFHFESEPGVRHAQGMENIVRRTPAYEAWRSEWETAFAQTGHEEAADMAAQSLWLDVLREHPIHGSDGPSRHPRLR